MELIERSAAIKAITGIDAHGNSDRANALGLAEFQLTILPAVDAVEVRHGRWKIKTVREYDLSYGGRIYIPEYVCGCCGHYYESYVRGDEPIMPEDADFPMYCEQCGAKMDGKDGDNHG